MKLHLMCGSICKEKSALNKRKEVAMNTKTDSIGTTTNMMTNSEAENTVKQGLSSSSSPLPTLHFHFVGDAYVDIFCFLEGSLPEEGGDARLAQPIQSMPGGSAVNTTTHFAALMRHYYDSSSAGSTSCSDDNYTITLHTALNPDDEYGKLQLEHANRFNLKLINCIENDDDDDDDDFDQSKTMKKKATGHCVVMVSRGERSFMTHNGSMEDLHASDLQHLFDTQSSSSSERLVQHLHIAGYYNIEGFWNGALQKELTRFRSNTNERTDMMNIVSLVPQHDATGVWDGGLLELLPLLDFLFVNELEANHIVSAKKNKLSSQGATSASSEDEWVNFFTHVSPHTCVVITRGALGAIAIHGGILVASQPAVALTPVDPTGAGDAFVAGFLYGIWKQAAVGDVVVDKKWHWKRVCIRQGLLYGVAVGSCSVLTAGASIPSTPSNIDSFIEQTIALS